MPDTYTQIHIQIVFSVQNRQSLISEKWKGALYKYITAIIQNNGHKLLSIGGMPDHIHLLIGYRPSQSLADLMKQVKQDSSKWINQNKFVAGKFSWQQGYGAFSYSKNQIPVIMNYIENQYEHHKTKKFIEEYRALLEEFNIEYNEQYIFKEIE